MWPLLYSPLTWSLLWLAVLPLLWRRLGRWSRAAGVVIAFVLVALLTPAGGNALVGRIEARAWAEPGCDAGWNDAPVVVLSAGFDGDPAGEDAIYMLSAESWRRLRGALDAWRRTPRALLVISGGGPFEAREADALASLAADWGVPRDRLRVERESTTTWTSAARVRAIAGARVRLATSALHMPRALLAYRAAGYRVCALPTGALYNPPGGPGYFLPQRSGLERSERAIYELLGLVQYRMRAG